MKKVKVIKLSNLPMRLPIGPTIDLILAQRVFNFSEWALGVVWSLLAILWIVAIVAKVMEQPVDLLKDRQ